MDVGGRGPRRGALGCSPQLLRGALGRRGPAHQSRRYRSIHCCRFSLARRTSRLLRPPLGVRCAGGTARRDSSSAQRLSIPLPRWAATAHAGAASFSLPLRLPSPSPLPHPPASLPIIDTSPCPRSLHELSPSFSPADLAHPGAAGRSLGVLQCRLHSGDVLYLPPEWWHQVATRSGPGGGLSVALNWWQGPELLGETYNAYWARPYLQALRSLSVAAPREKLCAALADTGSPLGRRVCRGLTALHTAVQGRWSWAASVLGSRSA